MRINNFKILKNFYNIIIGDFKLRSIRTVIAVSFTLITVCAMLFVGISLYSKFSVITEKNVALSTRQVIDQVNYNLDSYLRNMMDVSNLLYYNVIKNQNIPDNKLAEQMNVIINTRKDIVSLAVFSENGELLAGSPLTKLKVGVDVKNEEWFKKAISKPENLYFSTPHLQNLFDVPQKNVLSLSRAVTLNKNGENIYGVLLVDMNFSFIELLAQKVSLGQNGYVFITSGNGEIVYHKQQQQIYAGIKRENNYELAMKDDGSYTEKFEGQIRLITIKTVGYTGWKIIGISYMDDFIATKKEIKSFIGWILLFGIFFVIFISSYISYKISQPVKRLEESMRLVENGNFDINVEVKGEDEVVQLSKAFNLMVSKIKQLMSELVNEQEAKRKTELEALQSQINPHFLYNTLDSIVWMAEKKDNEEVITMVSALAKLFRISISKGKNVITVRQELEHAKNYLIIQKRRYKDKFLYEFNIQEEVLSYYTLKLLLQPIIENAIYHGIEYMVDQGKITINASIEKDMLLFEVRDNGLGMPPEKLAKLLNVGSEESKGSGVGFKNVHQRIQLFYGKEYGLDIQSIQEEGTTVKVWLPLVSDEKI